MRRRGFRALTALLGARAVAAVLGAVALGQGATAPPHARAVVFPSTGGGSAEVTGPGSQTASGSAGGGLDGSGTATATATAHTAAATVSTSGISAFGGLVSAAGVSVRASAADGSSTVTGTVRGLVVDGRAIGSPASPASYSMRFGSVSVLGATGLTVTLSQPYHSFPAGTSLSVGLVEASAPAAPAAPKPRPRPRPAPRPPGPPPVATVPAAPSSPSAPPRARPSAPTSSSPTRSSARHPARRGRTRHLPRRRAPKVHAPLTGAGYSFPVASAQAATADNFGAAREIGAHQGDDIFAPFGTPVLAVHDGTIGKVGTLPISGNRLWLYAPGGDAFFYAHLSAFSPAAVDGQRVKAGDVLGFVGNTGDAEPTPPHLHFEAHPGGEEKPAVDPFGILRAWRKGTDVDRGAWMSDTAERPGTLVQIRDFLAEK